ncbi:DedA family protein [Ruania suaedae]|uniref:DedA family protein n=1 Tax=Ruania suaedae TaxID=2897774 RepID=UPI001E2D8D9A|nr:DedA family protein [Ruania suaedae]UFU04272.1 DedA family protein [Ruania suaedae]
MLPTIAREAVAPAAEYEGFIGWVLSLMTSVGEVGVGLALFIETFFPPMPSEAVLPGAGFLAWDGRISFWGAVAGATIGGLVGAWVWYALGAAFGRERTRALVRRTPLLEVEDFDKAEAVFTRWGAVAVLAGRCVPMVRSFISIPAGIERMNFGLFTLYTFLGSAVWNTLWIGLGFAFGPTIEPVLARWSGILSTVVVVIVALLLLWFVLARIRKLRRRNGSPQTPA